MEGHALKREHAPIREHRARRATVQAITVERRARVRSVRSQLVHSARLGSKLEEQPPSAPDNTKTGEGLDAPRSTETSAITPSAIVRSPKRQLPAPLVGDRCEDGDGEVSPHDVTALAPFLEPTARVATEAAGDDTAHGDVKARRGVHVTAAEAREDANDYRIFALTRRLRGEPGGLVDEHHAIALSEDVELAAVSSAAWIHVEPIARLEGMVERRWAAIDEHAARLDAAHRREDGTGSRRVPRGDDPRQRWLHSPPRVASR